MSTLGQVASAVVREQLHAEYVEARLNGYTRTLRDIRDSEGCTPVIRFRIAAVTRALHKAGYPPSVKNVEICCRRAELGEVRRSGGWTLNGRDCEARWMTLRQLGYVQVGHRWKLRED